MAFSAQWYRENADACASAPSPDISASRRAKDDSSTQFKRMGAPVAGQARPERPGSARSGGLNTPVSVEPLPRSNPTIPNAGQPKGSIPNERLCGWYSGGSGGTFFRPLFRRPLTQGGRCYLGRAGWCRSGATPRRRWSSSCRRPRPRPSSARAAWRIVRLNGEKTRIRVYPNPTPARPRRGFLAPPATPHSGQQRNAWG
jgi:hypothetical protein